MRGPYAYIDRVATGRRGTLTPVCRSPAYAAPEEEPQLGDFPPSAKLVYLTLEYEGSLTQKELVHETELASRTVRSALSTLTDAGYVSEELYLEDLRQRKYVVIDR